VVSDGHPYPLIPPFQSYGTLLKFSGLVPVDHFFTRCFDYTAATWARIACTPNRFCDIAAILALSVFIFKFKHFIKPTLWKQSWQ
jgi:hypothetical protein